MDFAKFISLLEVKALFFCRADLLGDPFEYSSTKMNVALEEAFFGDLSRKSSSAKPLKALSNLRASRPQFRQSMFINCWHMNEAESAAMWSLYSLSNQGVCITTRYESLCNELSDDVYIGKVTYIDYETAYFPLDNLLYPIMHKRKSFEHENEVRAVIWSEQHKSKERSAGRDSPPGITVPVDITNIIEKIYVNPSAPDWYYETIASILKRYGYDIEVTRSNISNSPIF